jgi:hypothetical protein
MSHKPKNQSYNYKNKISLVVLLLVIAWFIIIVVKKGKTNTQVYQKGEITKAIIIDKRRVGGKGIERCTYSFLYNNIKYEGWVNDDDFKIGDTIQILFLKENPEINRSKKFIDRINE